MGNEKWGNYTQEFTLGHDAEEIKNVQAILNRPRSCTDFSPAARYAVQRLVDYAKQEHELRRTAQEWISVKDRLPKNDEIVIICTDKNFIYAGELIGDTWFLDNDSWTATVTHWMPLPQPPKGE